MRTQTQGVGLQSPHSCPLQIITCQGLHRRKGLSWTGLEGSDRAGGGSGREGKGFAGGGKNVNEDLGQK